jgi:hypothetical protein
VSLGPDGTPAGLIAHLTTLREQARVLQAAVAAEAVDARDAAVFATTCDQAARAVLDLAEHLIIDQPVTPPALPPTGRP